MPVYRYVFFFFFSLFLLSGEAIAQNAPKRFAVLPFTVNGPARYAYLKNGLQDMLISRLNWEGKLEPVNKDTITRYFPGPPKNTAQALAAPVRLRSEYVVWGSVTLLGDDCSVDMQIVDRTGKTWSQQVSAPLQQLIPSLEGTAQKIAAQILGLPPVSDQSAARTAPATNRMNPELVHNESAQKDFYLNPQFRYAGDNTAPGRIRSPRLSFAANGMKAADVDSDGQTELFFISEHEIYAYRVENGRYQLLDEMGLGTRATNININTMDIDHDGRQEILVSGIIRGKSKANANFDKNPSSFILRFENNKFSVVAKGLRFFLNAVALPPTYEPVLLGQRTGKIKFFEEKVYKVAHKGGKYILSKRLGVPQNGNIFNLTYLPTGDGSHKILLVDERDHIRVYNTSLALQATTANKYAGSGIGMRIPDTMPGFATQKDQYSRYYYVPLRVLVRDVNGDGRYEVIANKNISVASEIFDTYRAFPNGELHAMNWDGVGLSLLWKTRRIKGTVVDYGIADIDNNGVPDLYACINSHTGGVGLDRRRALLTAYPLDTSRQDQTIRTNDE